MFCNLEGFVSGSHVHQFNDLLVIHWGGFQVFNKVILLIEESLPVCFGEVKASLGWNSLWDDRCINVDTNWAMLCSRDWFKNEFIDECGNVGDNKH